MNGIRLKLTSHDVEQMIYFLSDSVANAKSCGYNRNHEDKHILASLGELLHKLSSSHNCCKLNYNLTIPSSQALALVVHCKRTKRQRSNYDTILLNDVIGRIDNKTVSNF